MLRWGFKEVEVMGQTSYPVDAMFKDLKCAEGSVASIKVLAKKAERRGR